MGIPSWYKIIEAAISKVSDSLINGKWVIIDTATIIYPIMLSADYALSFLTDPDEFGRLVAATLHKKISSFIKKMKPVCVILVFDGARCILKAGEHLKRDNKGTRTAEEIKNDLKTINNDTSEEAAAAIRQAACKDGKKLIRLCPAITEACMESLSQLEKVVVFQAFTEGEFAVAALAVQLTKQGKGVVPMSLDSDSGFTDISREKLCWIDARLGLSGKLSSDSRYINTSLYPDDIKQLFAKDFGLMALLVPVLHKSDFSNGIDGVGIIKVQKLISEVIAKNKVYKKMNRSSFASTLQGYENLLIDILRKHKVEDIQPFLDCFFHFVYSPVIRFNEIITFEGLKAGTLSFSLGTILEAAGNSGISLACKNFWPREVPNSILNIINGSEGSRTLKSFICCEEEILRRKNFMNNANYRPGLTLGAIMMNENLNVRVFSQSSLSRYLRSCNRPIVDNAPRAMLEAVVRKITNGTDSNVSIRDEAMLGQILATAELVSLDLQGLNVSGPDVLEYLFQHFHQQIIHYTGLKMLDSSPDMRARILYGLTAGNVYVSKLKFMECKLQPSQFLEIAENSPGFALEGIVRASMKDKEYTVLLVFRKPSNVKVKSFFLPSPISRCSCPAGLVTCSHQAQIVAMVGLYINQRLAKATPANILSLLPIYNKEYLVPFHQTWAEYLTEQNVTRNLSKRERREFEEQNLQDNELEEFQELHDISVAVQRNSDESAPTALLKEILTKLQASKETKNQKIQKYPTRTNETSHEIYFDTMFNDERRMALRNLNATDIAKLYKEKKDKII